MNVELERLYDAALKLPRDAQASFAAEACGDDDALRAELLSLLAATEKAESFFAEFGRIVLSPAVVADAVDGVAALKAGSAIGRYTILERLGGGGMGTVYRARDTRLGREVALKFLHTRFSGDVDFDLHILAEARAAAALQHPNICVVHEIAELPNGQPFIAMALCEGQTLKHRIAEGPIAAEEAVAIAAQVARALREAHSHQIIHRDVKPGNIIVEADGTVKLLDFGVAISGDSSDSRPGSTPGTVAYMSPEQLRGEQLDGRTDLWSLGVVLYEMLVARRPFRGGNGQAVMHSILHDQPASVPSLSPDTPVQIVAVVERLLAKNRDARFPSASALLSELAQAIPVGRVPAKITRPVRKRRAALVLGVLTLGATLAALLLWSGGQRARSWFPLTVPGRAEPSIAVLPMANLSPDTVDAPLASGITEDLIVTLASATNVRVIASASTAAFRDRKNDFRQIAESLGVSNILLGAVRKNGSQLRVEVRLMSARDGLTVWSQTYDRQFKDVFTVQDDIVRTIVGELGLRFDKDQQLRRHGTRSVAAYELYLRASDPLLLRSQSGVWKAVQYFQEAIAVDSTYAAAHAGMALAQIRRGRTTSDPGMPLPDLFALAEKSARKAVGIDDSLPEAHYSLGRVLEAELNFPSAEREIRRAIVLDPTRSIYHRALSTMHGWAGRPDEELAEARLALETDPLNPYAIIAVAGALTGNGRYAESLAQLARVAGLKPPLQATAFVAAQDYAKLNRMAEAIAALRPQAERGDPLFQGLLGCMLGRAGKRDEAEKVLGGLRARRDRTGSGAFQIAMVNAGLGDFDQAFEWLNKSVDDRSISSMIMGPTFDDLHRDPRFQLLKTRLGTQGR
jgi:TolB-like protein/tetratricopeptide (TPR) repeat protein